MEGRTDETLQLAADEQLAEVRLTERNVSAIIWVVTGALTASIVIGPVLTMVHDLRQGYFAIQDYVVQLLMIASCGVLLFGVLARASWSFSLPLRARSLGIGLAIHLAVVGAGYSWVRWTRQEVITGVIARAQAVVDAIHAFERDRGRAPGVLAELVPDFLPSVPGQLLRWGADIDYEFDPTTGAWSIGRDTFQVFIGIEYAPGAPSRPLNRYETRFGDWIVWSCDP